MADDQQQGPPDSNFDVTPNSGYTFEDRVPRNSNGFGGTQTKLPRGHLARRDTMPAIKHAAVVASTSASDDEGSE